MHGYNKDTAVAHNETRDNQLEMNLEEPNKRKLYAEDDGVIYDEGDNDGE